VPKFGAGIDRPCAASVALVNLVSRGAKGKEMDDIGQRAGKELPMKFETWSFA
jgi:hypothetical protein